MIAVKASTPMTLLEGGVLGTGGRLRLLVPRAGMGPALGVLEVPVLQQASVYKACAFVQLLSNVAAYSSTAQEVEFPKSSISIKLGSGRRVPQSLQALLDDILLEHELSTKAKLREAMSAPYNGRKRSILTNMPQKFPERRGIHQGIRKTRLLGWPGNHHH